MKSISILCALVVPAAGCYTAGGRATDAVDRVSVGMSEAQVRRELGEPDQVRILVDESVGAPHWEWIYVYKTPWTMMVFPMLLVFTVVLAPAGFFWGMAVGMTDHADAALLFGPGGILIQKEVRVFGAGF